jgi:hypothetical protein
MIWHFDLVIRIGTVVEFGGDRLGTVQKLIDVIITNIHACASGHDAAVVNVQEFF